MDREQIIARIRHDSLVVKDFVVKQYHRFADYLAKKKVESQNNGCTVIFGMKFSKYLFIVMNIFYLLISLFMIFTGISSLAANNFYNVMWFDAQVLSTVWILSGVMLAFISAFGIVAAFKESITWSNIYGVLLMITFLIQIFGSVASFRVVTTDHSSSYSYNLIDQLMTNYYKDSISAQKMDYIQSSFQCCGLNNPSDWDTLVKMHETDGRFDYYGEQDYEITEALLPYTSDVPDTTPTIAETTSIKETTDVLKYKTPASCCTHNRNDWTSGIRYQNHTCDNYYEKGCAMYVKDFISEIILIASSVLLAIGVLQILGMVASFMLARMYRRASAYRNVKKFNSQYKKFFDVPTYVDYRPLNDSNESTDHVHQI